MPAKSPIPGVAPPEVREVASMTVWPSIAAFPTGRTVGKLCGMKQGFGCLTLGKFLALAMIPVSLVLYFWKIMPGVCRRYVLTNRRVVVQKGLKPADEDSVDLDGFDEVRIEVLPGQEWLHAGDLLFCRQGKEALRLPGVLRPEVFREICLKSQASAVAIRKTLEDQSAA